MNSPNQPPGGKKSIDPHYSFAPFRPPPITQCWRRDRWPKKIWGGRRTRQTTLRVRGRGVWFNTQYFLNHRGVELKWATQFKDRLLCGSRSNLPSSSSYIYQHTTFCPSCSLLVGAIIGAVVGTVVGTVGTAVGTVVGTVIFCSRNCSRHELRLRF